MHSPVIHLVLAYNVCLVYMYMYLSDYGYDGERRTTLLFFLCKYM